ncbi:MAG: DTW domain-containing protein [Rhodospirillaceae bacterium]|nr:DTW domain-containing protein [Rhodospirillaceae bacterium]
MSETPAADTAAPCPRCNTPAALCVCEGITPIDNRIALLILQHPQEQDMELGTARLAALHLKNATLKIGLSWPSLGKALGRNVDPKRWAVLYLGSAKAESVKSEIIALNRKGTPAEDQSLKDIDGIIVLDGTWSQAKALWWRNAWMLKTRRIALNPRRPSRYGKLRREPRRDSVSTLEAAALLLSRLENKPEIETAMIASFEKLLTRYRALRALSKAS